MAVPRTQFYHPAKAIDAALHSVERAIRRATPAPEQESKYGKTGEQPDKADSGNRGYGGHRENEGAGLEEPRTTSTRGEKINCRQTLNLSLRFWSG
jgi:hypothetical protein